MHDNDNCPLCEGFPEGAVALLGHNVRMALDITLEDDQLDDLLGLLGQIDGVELVDIRKNG